MMKRLLVSLLLLGLAAAGAAEPARLVILHTNDLHGHIETYDQGGLERIAYLVEQYRLLYPGEVILLDAGDTSLGTPLSGAFHGRPTAELMAHMGYDAVALGNHEFNWGKEALWALIEGLNAPVLSANVVNADGSPPPFQGYTVVEKAGLRIAVIGLVTPETSRKAPAHATAGWNFLPPEEAVRSTLSGLPEVDAVIALTHLGLEADKALAEAVPEIDLVVGGHSHTPLHKEVYAGKVPIVQAGCYGRYLGVAEVLVDPDENSLELVDYRLVSALSAAGSDEGARRIVERYAEELRPVLEREVASVAGPVSKQASPGSWDTPLGNLISDVFRAEAETDVAVYNRGGVRFDMKPGALTVAEVHRLFPFDDPVVVLEATGRQLREVIEQGSVGGQGPLSASGLTALVENGRVTQIALEGVPLEDDATYSLATTAFLAAGGDGMTALSGLKEVRRLGFTRDVLLEHLRTHPTLQPPPVGRIKVGKRASSPAGAGSTR